MKFQLPIICIFLLFLSGCGSKTKVLINSNPPGASVSEIGTSASLGTTPTSTHYKDSDLEKFRQPDGCHLISGLTAKWKDGATTSTVNPLKLCKNAAGEYKVTLNKRKTITKQNK